jgi:hypothetical protein
MTEYERSRTMPAQPEHVFDQAAHVDQLDSWLPGDLHVRADDLPAVTVHEDRLDDDTRAWNGAPATRAATPAGCRSPASTAGPAR